MGANILSLPQLLASPLQKAMDSKSFGSGASPRTTSYGRGAQSLLVARINCQIGGERTRSATSYPCNDPVKSIAPKTYLVYTTREMHAHEQRNLYPPPLPAPLPSTHLTRAPPQQAQRSHGDPFDERPINQNGTTGEYALAAHYHLIFTPLMFLICAILLFWEFSLNDWVAEPISENPSYGPSVETLLEAGAKRTDLIVDNGDWWRMISRELFFPVQVSLPAILDSCAVWIASESLW